MAKFGAALEIKQSPALSRNCNPLHAESQVARLDQVATYFVDKEVGTSGK